MKEFWNERYQSADYIYGIQPNEFLVEHLTPLPIGEILFVAEGEGRNAVFAAKLGWHVTAIDFSQEGKKKALDLASANQVVIDYQVIEAEKYDYPTEKFDAIALIYAHFDEPIRSFIHQKCIDSLKKGGTILLEAFNKNQLNYTSGGPKKESMLYNTEMLEKDFKNLAVKNIIEMEVELAEGEFHNGTAEVIRFIGKKL